MTVRVRFPPSPTGDLHVGNVRSALFNWAYARHTGGVFVFRIEDTDAARNTEDSYEGVLDDLRWLGLDWDEGPDIGGPYGPYRQSERSEIYREVAGKLLAGGYAYESYSTPEESSARHVAAGRNPKLGYDGFDRTLTDAQKRAFRDEGRPVVLRLRMPDSAIRFTDLIRGELSFEPTNVPDPALQRGDGSPLYTLTNPVDDALQKISHVVRGDDLLSSTPRQIPVHHALRDMGMTNAPMPEFGHLPMVTGEGGQRLSKRNTPEASLKFCRERGYLPEGLLNYLALLGWAIAEDRDVFSLAEMVRAFDVTDVGSNPGRFDAKKSEAINGSWIRRLGHAELADRIVGFLRGRGVLDGRAPTAEADVRAATPLVAERMTLLGDAADLLAFLTVGEDEFGIDEAAAAKVLGTQARPVLAATLEAVRPLARWDAEGLEAALRTALVDGLGLRPRLAFGPVRVAVTGKQVSPPLFESMQILGRDRTLSRLRSALSGLGGGSGLG